MRFKSIYQKIVIPMVLIVCFLGLAILGTIGTLFTDIYERQIYEENRSTADFVAQSVGSFMEMAYHDDYFATDIKLEKIQEAVAGFSDVEEGRISFVIDGEGVVVAHPEPVYYEELYNYKNMTRTVTVKDEAGNVVYDDDGNIVTEDLPITVSAGYAAMIEQVMAGNAGEGLITDNGKEYYISYEPIPMQGVSDFWSVITLREKDAALSLMNQIVYVGAAATVVAVILAAVLILLLTRSITRPVQICLERLKGLSQGDLSTEVLVMKGRDESAQLLIVLSDTVQTLKAIMDDISGQLCRIAHGDLTDRGEHSYCGEFDVLGKSLNKINRSLNQSFRQVGIQSQRVSRNADLMSDMAQSLARDTAVQASAVEQLSATIHGTAESSRESARNALLVKEKMAQVDTDMNCSNESINKLLAAMSLISEDSRKINGISKTIQDISFQTNLLSMNASVEAARAGEAGKGFSVIASEIRELSEHCSQAATDTTELIEVTLKELDAGMTALKTAVSVIDSSTSDAAEANRLIGEIAVAAEEQMESMKQISLALEQISGVVQSNSQMAKESASSGEEMKENAYRLEEAVQRYQF